MDAHLFICTNRKKGECCADKGSEGLRDRVKKACKKAGWKGKVRVNAAGCLGRCEEGIAAVLYPEGRWMTNLREGDDEKLVEAVREALHEKGLD